jgi:hypothetical protein
MKRFKLALFLSAVVTLAADVSAQNAVEVPSNPPRVAPRGALRRPSGYGVDVIYQHRGYITHRYTYPGYKNGFPPPAFLYYGYPGSGFSHGVGF